MGYSKWNCLFDVDKVTTLDKEGVPSKIIANMLKIPYRRYYDLIKKNNIKLVSKGQTIPKNNNFFNTIDSELKAYILGYVLADGCVIIEPKKRNGVIYSYSKRLCFCSSIDDREVLELIQKSIAPTSKLKEFHNAKGALIRKNQLTLRFSSIKIVDDLINLNIKPRKTYDFDFTFDFNKIPKKLIRHFIRGFFDGDGTSSKRNISFIGTSLPFFNQLNDIIKEFIPGISSYFIKQPCKNVMCYNLHFNLGFGYKAKFIDFLYKDANYYLKRKYTKLYTENIVLNN